MATVTWLVYLPSKNRFREINVDGSTGRGVNGKPTANSRFKHARMRSRGNSICQFFLWTQAFPLFFVHCSAELLYSSSLACQNKFGSRQIMKRLSSSHIYDRSIHTQHLSLVWAPGRSLQTRYHRNRISGPLAFFWNELVVNGFPGLWSWPFFPDLPQWLDAWKSIDSSGKLSDKT